MIYKEEEIEKHNTPNDAWIVVDNKVYDITEFIDQHPGGVDVLEEYFGKDASKAMKDETIHSHSSSAYSMLSGYVIGDTKGEEGMYELKEESIESSKRVGWGKVDFTKAILFQACSLGDDYYDWVENDPLHFKECVRLFENNTMEALSRNKWYTIPIVWIPIIFISLFVSLTCSNSWISSSSSSSSSQSLFDNVSNPQRWIFSGAVFVLGFMLWSILEYTIHKFVFHCEWLAKQGYFITNWMHFLLHGFHHKIPMDKDRLVMPIPLAIVIITPLLFTAYMIFPSISFIAAGLAGTLSGYIMYDMIHYSIHHADNVQSISFYPLRLILSSKFFQNLRRHHMIHHFAPHGNENNYGISHTHIDVLLGSLQSSFQVKTN